MPSTAENLYIEYSRWHVCFMLTVGIDVEAPTAALFNNLYNWYLFLGFAAGTVVTVWMMYNIVTNRTKNVKEAPKFHEEEEGPWGNWKTVLMTLLVTGSVLAFVEYETFASVGLINHAQRRPSQHQRDGTAVCLVLHLPQRRY